MPKQSTIIHHDMLAIVHEMPDEMAGRFVKILHAAMLSDIPLPEDFSLKMAIMPFISQIKRDQEKYKSVCDRNKLNGSKGGRPGNPNNPTEPTGFNGNPNNPTEPDNGSGSGSDNDTGTEKKTALGDKPPVSVPSKNLFEIFWKEYPKKKAKGDAEKAFKAAKITEGFLGEVVASIHRQKKTLDWQKDNGRFIPHPATWIRDKRWADELETGSESEWE